MSNIDIRDTQVFMLKSEAYSRYEQGKYRPLGSNGGTKQYMIVDLWGVIPVRVTIDHKHKGTSAVTEWEVYTNER